MTLGELIRKTKETGDMFNTYDVPLKINDWDVYIKFVLERNNEDKNYVINMLMFY